MIKQSSKEKKQTYQQPYQKIPIFVFIIEQGSKMIYLIKYNNRFANQLSVQRDRFCQLKDVIAKHTSVEIMIKLLMVFNLFP